MLLADVVVLLHAAFIAWVGFGVFFLKRHPRLRLLHLASVVYGLAIEVWPFICPLTHAENWLRLRAGAGLYREDFIVHYLGKVIYLQAPPWILVAVAAVVVAYTLALDWRWGFRPASPPPPVPSRD